MSVETFGERLRSIRELRGLSQQGLSDLLGGTPSRSTIANWEVGRRADIYVGELVALARALRVEPSALCPEVAPSTHEREVALSIHRLRQVLDDVTSHLRFDHPRTEGTRVQ